MSCLFPPSPFISLPLLKLEARCCAENNPPLQAGEATIVTDGDEASGVWKGTGFEFQGTPDLSKYTVTVDSPALGISGTLELTP